MPVSTSNRTIARNTMLLYLRQFIILAISLYTSRLVLATLGVSDYGIYNVVGSVVTMFVFIRSAMGNATNRYIAFAIGKGETDRLKTIFSTCLYVHLLLALIIVLLTETVGLWLLYNKLDIPDGRMNAAFWVMQFSILTCAVGVLCVPYDAEMIAHEKMGAFAFLSIVEVTMKLLLVYLLRVIPFDRLIFYGLFLLLVQLMNRVIYGVYCWRKFPETRNAGRRDPALIKEMFGFAGWNLLGNMAAIVCAPLINVFLNMFFGPVVNAARGVALQVQGAVRSFISNFQLAVIPQITKNYASGNLERMKTLIISSSKLSFFLFLIMAMPLFLEADSLLSVWLVKVPEHSVNFMRLVLLVMLAESWEQPLHNANLATGKIKVFQTAKGVSLLMTLPLSYLALKLGAPAESVFVIQLLVTLSSLIIQLFILRPQLGLSLRKYFSEVFGRTFIVTLVSAVLPVLSLRFFGDGAAAVIAVILISVLSVCVTVYYLGLNAPEKDFVRGYIRKFTGKVFNSK
ncbi:MAG: lipopolysaccharide biosynthesis protein [Bacteroidales bacterium]|nr:lipopolysaccharide biosynthesis protein [Bacteroidales bacterium]